MLIGVFGSAGRSWSELEPFIQEALGFNTDDERLTCWLAESLRQQKRYDEAENLLRQVVSKNPRSALAYLGLANVAEYRGDPEATRMYCATEASKHASEASARPSEVTRIAAHLLTGGRTQQAKSLLERLPALADAWGYLYLAVLLERDGSARSKEFLEKARKGWADEHDFNTAVEQCRAAAAAHDT